MALSTGAVFSAAPGPIGAKLAIEETKIGWVNGFDALVE
jgi:hypothetical protein